MSGSTANQITPSNDSLGSEIEDILSSGKPVFLFLYVDWCHFCQQQIPIIDELEQEYNGKITFIRVNCEKHPDAMTDLEARGYPSMFLILGRGDDGNYGSQFFRGFTDKETLKGCIDGIITNGSINENSKENELGIGASSTTLLINDEKYTGRIFPLSAASAGSSIEPETNAQELSRLNHESELLEFTLKSEKAIIGQYPDFDVSFSSVLEQDDYVIVDIRLSDKKQLIAQINYKDKTFQIQFISLENGQLVKLTKGDLHTFHVLHSNLPRHFPTFNMPKDALLSTLNLLEDYPPNELFNVSKEREEKTSASGIVSLCTDIGKIMCGTYDIYGVPFTECVQLGPCNSGGCMGRCGPGCGSPPGPEIQRFTQDCFNHDLCTRATGNPLGPCEDEWIAAADDFLQAPNCADYVRVMVRHVSSGSGCDTNVPVKFKVINTGNFFDTYNLEAVCAPWPCPACPSSVGPIASGAERLVTVYVEIQAPCQGDECTGFVLLEATSQCNPDVSEFTDVSFTLSECCTDPDCNSDYYDDWEYYCDGDNRRKHRLFHDFYCDGGSCKERTSWKYDQLVEDCNDRDGCYAYGNGCEHRDYFCSDGSCAYTYSNRHTDYYDNWVYYCVGDEVWRGRWFHDFRCEGGECVEHIVYHEWEDEFVENCNDYDSRCCLDNYPASCDYSCVSGSCFLSKTADGDPCPEGTECEDGECKEVPEFPAGVTAVFGATFFIFLMMRRKYVRK